MFTSTSLKIKSVLFLAGGIIIASGASLSAAVILQVSSNASGQSWATAATWSNAAAASAGNDYFTNGYTLRTPDSPAGTATFPGSSLTVDGGTGGATGALNLKAGTTNITNLSIGNGAILNGNASGGNLPATINITNFTILSAATSSAPAAIRGTNSGNNMTINVSNLSGSGYLSIGGGATGTRDYAVGITDASAFTGTFNLFRGNLNLTSDLSLESAATFTMNSTNTSLALNNDLSTWSFSYGGSALAVGVYSSSDLNTHYSTSVFSGLGTLSVVPEPTSSALVFLAASTFVLVFRMKRRTSM